MPNQGWMSGAKQLVVGVLAALVALPFLTIVWLGMNTVMIGLFVEDPGGSGKAICYLASGFLVARDVWVG